MKKIVIAAAALVILCLIALFILWSAGAKQTESGTSAPTTSTLPTAKAPLPTTATLAATNPVAQTSESQKTTSKFTEIPVAQLPDAKDEPLWGVEIGPVPPGKYDYRIVIDGTEKRMSQMSYRTGRQQFTFPPDADDKLQKQIGSDRIQFYHIGKIKRFAWFISSLTDSEWGMQEMRPLNAAAQANLREISADPSLIKAEGVVVDSQNRPVPNARVLMNQTYQFERAVQCNESGQFFVERLPRANLAFSGKGWGFTISSPQSIGPDASGKFPAIKIVLEHGVIVTGRVRDEVGKPIFMASLSSYPVVRQPSPYNYRPPSPVRTDKDGIYVLGAVQPGPYNFQVSEEKTGMMNRKVTIPNQTAPFQLDFTLANGGTIAVKAVRSGANGDEPAKGVGFAANMTAPPPKNADAEQQIYFYGNAETDAKGCLEFQGVPYGMLISVQPMENIYRQSADQAQTVTLEKGKPAPTLEFRVPPMAVVNGKVQDMEGKPIAGAEVQWQVQNGPNYGDPSIMPKVTTNEEGKFTCSDLSSTGQYYFTARAKGYGPSQSSSVSAATEDEVVITLKPGITLKGHVVFGADSQPVPNMTLRKIMPSNYNSKDEVTTDANGQFTCEDLAAGSCSFSGTKYRPEGSLVLSEQVTIDDSKPVQEKSLVAYLGRALHGTATLQETGEPVPDVNIQIYPERENYSRQLSANSASDGKFEFHDLVAARYRVMIQKSGLALVEKPNQEVAQQPWGQGKNLFVNVEKDKDPEALDLVFTKGGTVTGQVVDASDKPVSGCGVYATKSVPGNEGYGGNNYTSTDEQGKFSLSGIELGVAMKLRAQGQQGQGTSEEITLTKEKPQSEVRIKMGEGSALKGSVKDADGKPLGNANISIVVDEGNGKSNSNATRSDGAGNYNLMSLPSSGAADAPQSCKVSASLKGYETQSQDIKIQKDKPAECNFVLKKGVVFKGILVDLNKKELAGIRIWNNTPNGGGNYQEIITAYDGSFDIPGTNKVSLRFDMNSWGGGSNRNGSLMTGEFTPTEAETVFVVPLGAAVRGRLVDSVTQKPVSLRMIEIGINSDYNGQAKAEGTNCILQNFYCNQKDVLLTDGVFEFKNLPVGKLRFNFSSPAIVSKNMDQPVNVDLQTDLGDIPVSQGLSAEGRLIDAQTGQPCAINQNSNEQLYFQGSNSSPRVDSYPDGEGRFRLSGISLDTKELTLNATRYQQVKVPVGAPSNGLVNLGDIRLDKGESIIGTLKIPGDVPLMYASININQNNNNKNYNVQQGEKKFTASGLMPGQAKVMIDAQSYQGNKSQQYRYEKEITIIKGTPLVMEFVLEAPAVK